MVKTPEMIELEKSSFILLYYNIMKYRQPQYWNANGVGGGDR